MLADSVRLTRSGAVAPDARPDDRLVRAARQGDHDAFAVLVRRYLGGGHALATALADSDADAADVCQLAMIKAWERLGDCAQPERFAGWFFAIIRTTALDQRRAVRRRRQVDLSAAAAVPDRRPRPAGFELRDELAALIRTLPPIQREIVILADLEGWSHREIAAQVGCSELMSRRHLSDARRRLRTLLSARTAL